MALDSATGSPLDSPDNPASPGVARPSSLLDSDQGAQTDREGSMPEPERRMTQTISRVRKMETDLDELAQSNPGAAPTLRKVKDLLRRALQQIVATGGGQGETASPRMIG